MLQQMMMVRDYEDQSYEHINNALLVVVLDGQLSPMVQNHPQHQFQKDKRVTLLPLM